MKTYLKYFGFSLAMLFTACGGGSGGGATPTYSASPALGIDPATMASINAAGTTVQRQCPPALTALVAAATSAQQGAAGGQSAGLMQILPQLLAAQSGGAAGAAPAATTAANPAAPNTAPGQPPCFNAMMNLATLLYSTWVPASGQVLAPGTQITNGMVPFGQLASTWNTDIALANAIGQVVYGQLQASGYTGVTLDQIRNNALQALQTQGQSYLARLQGSNPAAYQAAAGVLSGATTPATTGVTTINGTAGTTGVLTASALTGTTSGGTANINGSATTAATTTTPATSGVTSINLNALANLTSNVNPSGVATLLHSGSPAATDVDMNYLTRPSQVVTQKQLSQVRSPASSSAYAFDPGSVSNDAIPPITLLDSSQEIVELKPRGKATGASTNTYGLKAH